jgi:hypothetical protein
MKIEEINPNEQTKLTKEALLFYSQNYDLTSFLYTKLVHINSDGTSHSHPVLTLSTKSSHYPERILSTFLHEQFHWWVSVANHDDFRAVMSDLKTLYPVLPEVGVSSTVFSTYLHLIINWLEFKATTKLIGEEKAEKVLLSYIHEVKIYEWIYTQVLENRDGLEKIFGHRNFIPISIQHS